MKRSSKLDSMAAALSIEIKTGRNTGGTDEEEGLTKPRMR
jgi:hypothetical protein